MFSSLEWWNIPRTLSLELVLSFNNILTWNVWRREEMSKVSFLVWSGMTAEITGTTTRTSLSNKYSFSWFIVLFYYYETVRLIVQYCSFATVWLPVTRLGIVLNMNCFTAALWLLTRLTVNNTTQGGSGGGGEGRGIKQSEFFWDFLETTYIYSCHGIV